MGQITRNMDSAPGIWPYYQLQTTVCLRYILEDGKTMIFYSNAITNDDQESDVEETGINIDKAKSTYWVTALS